MTTENDAKRNYTIPVPVITGTVSTGYLLNKWAGLPAYDDVAGCVTLLTAQSDEIARLRAALKPFAEFARVYIEEMGADRRPDDARLLGANEAHLTVGDMRAVLKALGEES